MDYGFVFDSTFNLSWHEQRELARRARDLGYTSGWAPGGVSSQPTTAAELTDGRFASREYQFTLVHSDLRW